MSKTSDRMREFEAYLGQKGLRLTGQREAIARVFLKAGGHVSAEELYRKVSRRDPRVGAATVYRTLKLLTGAGLASPRNFGDGFVRYESSERREHHDHLVCTSCGKIIEFVNDGIEKLQEKVASEHGFMVTDHRLEMYGLCSGCSR